MEAEGDPEGGEEEKTPRIECEGIMDFIAEDLESKPSGFKDNPDLVAEGSE